MISTHLSLLVVLVYVYIITSLVQTVNQFVRVIVLDLSSAAHDDNCPDTVVLY